MINEKIKTQILIEDNRNEIDLHIDDQGFCNACRFYEQRPEIDWKMREDEFKNILSSLE